MIQKPVRVRFAPSPTGPLHIGGVRTALYNYLFAKKHGGKCILRIEDTDQNRYVPGAEEYIIEALAWCGIKFDEGVSFGGGYGPYRQSERKDTYKTYAEQLIQSGSAYYAFDTAAELDALRQQYETNGKTFIYNYEERKKLKNSLTLTPEEVNKFIQSGEPYVVRFKIPENQEVNMHDIIRGDIRVNTSTLDDKILFKSDGMPTYHLANIVDDQLMQISHVIRGEEWLPSLPLHVLLYQAFGWEAPEFAHLPLLLKPAGNGKLSKRDGDKMGFPVFPLFWKAPNGETARGYREDGYFPEGFVNMLALLGWNPGTEQEIFTMDELVQSFSLERVGKSGSKFDPEKAKWFNHHYLQTKSNNELADLFMPLLTEKGIVADHDYVACVCGVVKERVTFVYEIWDQASYFFEAPRSFDEKFTRKNWKENTPEIIMQVHNLLENAEEFKAKELEEKVKSWIETRELGMGKVMNPLRLTLVGAGKGPHLFDIMEMIGKEETLKRINMALKTLK